MQVLTAPVQARHQQLGAGCWQTAGMRGAGSCTWAELGAGAQRRQVPGAPLQARHQQLRQLLADRTALHVQGVLPTVQELQRPAILTCTGAVSPGLRRLPGLLTHTAQPACRREGAASAQGGGQQLLLHSFAMEPCARQPQCAQPACTPHPQKACLLRCCPDICPGFCASSRAGHAWEPLQACSSIRPSPSAAVSVRQPADAGAHVRQLCGGSAALSRGRSAQTSLQWDAAGVQSSRAQHTMI